MPCPFTEGKKICETHCLMLYPTMIGFKQMNIWNLVNYLKIEGDIPKNINSSDSTNSIPIWLLIFNEGANGKPEKTINFNFDKSKNILQTVYKNTE